MSIFVSSFQGYKFYDSNIQIEKQNLMYFHSKCKIRWLKFQSFAKSGGLQNIIYLEKWWKSHKMSIVMSTKGQYHFKGWKIRVLNIALGFSDAQRANSVPQTERISYLTYCPETKVWYPIFMTLQSLLPSYSITFRALATCEWQLSRNKLCWNEGSI